VFIEDYGLVLWVSNQPGESSWKWKAKDWKPYSLEANLSILDEGALRIRLAYNGNTFSRIIENNDHFNIQLHHLELIIDKGREIEEHGRSTVILSKILYSLEISGTDKPLQKALKIILDEHLVYLFAETREERDV
jgi:hypothetical protein